MPKEKKIEEGLVRFCREHQIYTRKFASPSNRGVPDRIFCKDGKVVFMELKRPGNTPTTLQHHELDTLRKHGMIATWCDSYEKAVQILKNLCYVHEKNPQDLI